MRLTGIRNSWGELKNWRRERMGQQRIYQISWRQIILSEKNWRVWTSNWRSEISVWPLLTRYTNTLGHVPFFFFFYSGHVSENMLDHFYFLLFPEQQLFEGWDQRAEAEDSKSNLSNFYSNIGKPGTAGTARFTTQVQKYTKATVL